MYIALMSPEQRLTAGMRGRDLVVALHPGNVFIGFVFIAEEQQASIAPAPAEDSW